MRARALGAGIAAAALLVVGAGVFTSPAAAPDRERTPASLAAGLSPLKNDFNRARDLPRFLAVVSPTCPACRHGVDTLGERILDRPAQPGFRLFVVWAPMLSADDEPALQKMAARYGDARTTNYLDPDRRTGAALRTGLFPHARADMLRVLPPDHFFREHAEKGPADKPEWDIYLAFPAGAVWNDRPPRPLAWVRQAARFKTSPDGPATSLLWLDDYASAPVEGELGDAIGRMADRALGTSGS